jgi:hypothetical protein
MRQVIAYTDKRTGTGIQPFADVLHLSPHCGVSPP